MSAIAPEDVRTRLGAADARVTSATEVASWLPVEAVDGHKGTFGSALVVAGSIHYAGAAGLAAAAAYRAGAGLVTVALPASIHPVVASHVPEATFLPLSEDLGVLSRAGAPIVRGAWGRYRALLVGPGLTTQRPAAEFLDALLALAAVAGGRTPSAPIGFARARLEAPPGDASVASAGVPERWVVDADALNLLAGGHPSVRELPPRAVLTPHPGEMARLVGASAAEVAADRVATAQHAAADWGHVVVLKGALTVIAAPDGRLTVNPFANPALGTAGSGDVLAGAIAGLLAQGMPPFEAAAAGAYIHALAGEMAAAAVGRRGTTAGDVVRLVSHALARIEDEPTRAS